MKRCPTHADTTCSSSIIPLSPLETYILHLTATRQFTCLSIPKWYAMVDCSGSSFVILSRAPDCASYVCSCNSLSGEDSECIHVAAAAHIWENDTTDADQDHQYAQDPILKVVDKLSSSLDACFDGSTYSLLSRHRNNKLHCHSCSSVIQC